MVSTSAGFTVVEALVVITVLSILLAVAGPSLSGLVVTQQLKTAGFDLSSSLAHARNEALLRNVPVVVSPVNADWARGWTITEESGTVLRHQSPYARIAMSGPASVTFNGDGRANSVATPFALSATDASAAAGRCVRLRLNGRAYLTKGAC